MRCLVKARGFKVLIDHHVQPDIECDVMYSTSKTSSAAELVYNFLYKYLTPKRKFTRPIAEALYVGIITDTGSVTYACDQPSTYDVLRKIIASGVNGESIHRKVYDNYTISRMKLLGLALSQRMTVLPELGVSYMYLSKQDLLDNGFQIGDTEGFINYGPPSLWSGRTASGPPSARWALWMSTSSPANTTTVAATTTRPVPSSTAPSRRLSSTLSKPPAKPSRMTSKSERFDPSSPHIVLAALSAACRRLP